MDSHRHLRAAAGALGETGVVAVRVGEQHGVQIVEPAAQGRQGADQQVPVAERPGVDQGELSAVLDQIEVADAAVGRCTPSATCTWSPPARAVSDQSACTGLTKDALTRQA
jgi:hypothetical protein